MADIEEFKREEKFMEETAVRNLNIKILNEGMEAYIDISYGSYKKFLLNNDEKKLVEEKLPDVYKGEEVLLELSKKGIRYGVNVEELKKVSSREGVNKLLIAKGKPPIDDTDDIVQYKFQISKEDIKYTEDANGDIDYKSIGHVKPVYKGQVLCELIKGLDGEAGIDIYGKKINKKVGKRVSLKVGNGCEFRGNQIVAIIDGKTNVKNGKIEVSPVHEVNGDVDIHSGDIYFIGDIIINGEVKDGMKIESGSSIYVSKSINDAKLVATGNIKVEKNAIHSSIVSGGDDTTRAIIIGDLDSFKEQLENLYRDIKHVKEHNLVKKDISEGQLVMIIIESKFKNISKICKKVYENNKYITKDLLSLIRTKLINTGPLSIKDSSEINEIINEIIENKKNISESLLKSTDIEVEYSQDSLLKCTGKIVFTGKGEYISNIFANDSIIFRSDQSIARGGILRAKNTIKCGIVGSESGVPTKLIVDSNGHIYANAVFGNTTIIVGTREKTIENQCRQFHAYIGESGDLIIDKFAV